MSKEVILYGFGSGGAGLNFKIVGGTSQPASASENTIWVNTDVEITSYSFSATEPTEPNEGMVWIKTDTESTVEFNALKKNALQVYPRSAKQYVDGAWVDVNVQTYQAGKWVEWFVWDGYLFNYGDEYERITGGYVNTPLPITSGVASDAANITKNTDGSWKISGYADKGSAVVHTSQKIDLTDYSTLHLHGTAYDVYGYDRSGIGVWPDFENYINQNRAAWLSGYASTEEKEHTIDVSKLTGKYYIGFYVYTPAAYVKVNKMWLT